LLLGTASAFCFGADQAPSSDFLEFLGTGSQMGTQWIDPMSLRETPEPFASLAPVNKDASKRDRVDQQPDVQPQKDTSALPHRDDGENADD
jgi:hypothetical protein